MKKLILLMFCPCIVGCESLQNLWLVTGQCCNLQILCGCLLYILDALDVGIFYPINDVSTDIVVHVKT